MQPFKGLQLLRYMINKVLAEAKQPRDKE